MARVLILVGVLFAIMAVQVAAKSAMNPDFTYSFWRDVKNPNQYYALSLGWRLTFPKHVSRKVATQCKAFVTSAHRPFEHGWEQDHSVYNKGVEKGWILSRNAAGFTAPNLDAEACLADVLRHTYPTLEIALLCSLTVGWIAIAVVILCVAGCCMGVFALGTETWDARKRARQQQNLNTPVGVKPFAPAGYTPEPYYATGAGRVGTL